MMKMLLPSGIFYGHSPKHYMDQSYHVSFTTSGQGRNYFREGAIEVQEGWVISPRSHSKNLGLSDPTAQGSRPLPHGYKRPLTPAKKFFIKLLEEEVTFHFTSK